MRADFSCFNCGQYGNHLAAKCKLGPVEKVCYHCKGTDHLIADCPQRTSGQTPPSSGNGQARTGSSPVGHKDNGAPTEMSAE